MRFSSCQNLRIVGPDRMQNSLVSMMMCRCVAWVKGRTHTQPFHGCQLESDNQIVKVDIDKLLEFNLLGNTNETEMC